MFYIVLLRVLDVSTTCPEHLLQSSKSLPSDSSLRMDHLHMLSLGGVGLCYQFSAQRYIFGASVVLTI